MQGVACLLIEDATPCSLTTNTLKGTIMFSVCKMYNHEGDVDVMVTTFCYSLAKEEAMSLHRQGFDVEIVASLGLPDETTVEMYIH